VTIIMVEHRWSGSSSCAAQFSHGNGRILATHHNELRKDRQVLEAYLEQHHERRHRTGHGDSGQARLEVQKLCAGYGRQTFSSTSLRPFRAPVTTSSDQRAGSDVHQRLYGLLE